MLAAGTEEGAAGGLDDSLDGGVAAGAGLAGAAVGGDAEFFAGDLGAWHSVFGVGAGGGFGEDFLDCGVERLDFAGADVFGLRGWVDAGVPEGFARIDVANAGDAGLIEESWLDGGLYIGKDGFEEGWGEGGFEGLGAKSGVDLLDVFAGYELDFAEGSRVVEDDDAVVGEAAPEAGCVGTEAVVGEDVEVARHAEVDMEVLIGGEVDEDVFSAAADVEDGCAVEWLEVTGLVREDAAGAFDFDRVNA